LAHAVALDLLVLHELGKGVVHGVHGVLSANLNLRVDLMNLVFSDDVSNSSGDGHQLSGQNHPTPTCLW